MDDTRGKVTPSVQLLDKVRGVDWRRRKGGVCERERDAFGELATSDQRVYKIA